MTEETKIYSVGITGASGAIYGVRLTEELLELGYTVHLLITGAGWQVFREELNMDINQPELCISTLFPERNGTLYVHGLQEFTAPVASGSYRNDGMVVIPCSMGTLSKIAHSHSGSLVERTADVMLKEKRPLILVPRETPLHRIHLENMLRVSDAGGSIVPAMPGYYHHPQTMDDLVNFVVGKVLDHMNVPHQLFTRWGDQS
ncbi:UbiX family flavin prenyltransferase [Salsuginibacillus kocurii]|uniref:UbiX family flavin prenyltransferase n=1 Tax=Salsuginibacillus kocurii TaxID=427078 RepID=UPI00037704B4|nr:flavin prenyltransferase UbiX [Salsuginibacillus kocurii]